MEDGRLSGDDSFQCEEMSPSPEVPKGFELQFSSEPPAYMCVPDDSVSNSVMFISLFTVKGASSRLKQSIFNKVAGTATINDSKSIVEC